MSFTSVTGFAGGSVLSGFAGALQKCYWRGVPFSVTGEITHKGRKVAMHDYPFRDGGWAEDMGRAPRAFEFTGYLTGDIGPIMQLLLDTASEAPGPGLLIHPTIGAQRVMLLSCATAIRKEAMRVIECRFQFIEAGAPNLILSLIATAVSVVLAASSTLTSLGSSIGHGAGPAATHGAAVIAEGQAVVGSFGATCIENAADPAGLIGMATGITMTDPNNVSLGRFIVGNVSNPVPCLVDGNGTPDLPATVAELTGTIAAGRTTLTGAVTAASAAATAFTADTGLAMANSLAAVTEALRAVLTDPADQVRIFVDLSRWTFTDKVGADEPGLAGQMAVMRDSMAALCRRVALTSLAQASAAYRPISYQDALTVREAVADAIAVEMLAAGDAGDDESYTALRALRLAVVDDLTTRGATLPQMVTAILPAPLPSLAIAQRLYRDASRSDEVTDSADVPHPAFLPNVLQVLAR